MAVEPIQLTYFGPALGSPAVGILSTYMPAGTITRIDVYVPANVGGTGDLEFNVTLNGAAQFAGPSRPIIANGTRTDSLTGLSIVTADGDLLELDADALPSSVPDVPWGWTVYFDDGTTVTSPASTTEVLTGTSTSKSVTPDALAALWEQGSDIASSATISVGEGGYFNVTGTTGISDIDFGTDKAGRKVWLKFAGILTLTHGANLILPTGANVTTAAGDVACFVSEGSDVVRCISYTRANGQALAGGGGFTAASTTEVLTGTENAKGVTPDSLAALWEQGSNIASAATISIGEGGYFTVTGTTTVTDIDPTTDKAGRPFWLRFAGALVLTHGANLILPTGANITTEAGDTALFVSEGSDVVRCVCYQRADGEALAGGGGSNTGKQTIWIPASGMLVGSSSPAAAATLETPTIDLVYPVLDFDGTNMEFAQFNVAFPKSWDEGTVTFQVFWSSSATDTDGVAWKMDAVAVSDNEALDAPMFGSLQTVVDNAQSAAGELYVSAESSPLTIAGTPAADDLCFFRIYRDPSHASDTMSEDARLIGVKLFYTTNAGNDA